MRIYFLFLLSFLGAPSLAQISNVQKYFDTTEYYAVDSVFFKVNNIQQSLYMLYDRTDDESFILHKRGSEYFVYQNFLPCYHCQKGGSSAITYKGHKQKGDTIILVHDYLSGRDSAFLNFSPETPVISKIIRREYNNEKAQGSAGAGNFLFTAKKEAPITLFQFPINREDSIIKEHFAIKPIKWRRVRG
jgi:hypothetical protein